MISSFCLPYGKAEDAPDSRHQGRSRSRLLRALDNEEGGVSSAFLKGKQNGIFINKFISHLLKSYGNSSELTKMYKQPNT